MSKSDPLKELKTAARAIARARRIKHIGALEVIAQAVGHPHWNALTAAAKKGWVASAEDLQKVEELVLAENPLITLGVDPFSAVGPEKFEGELLGHGYRIHTGDDDVHMWGRGWELVLPEAPLAPPRFRVTDKRFKTTAIDDLAFREAAIEVASDWRKLIHARIASDWPRRSTVPDGDGRAEHPLFGGVSSTWYCLHCDHSATAAEITANLFHCPNCFATPLDIHPAPWWRGNAARTA